MAIKSSDQISIVDLTDGYSVILTNDSFTFAGTTNAAKAGSTTTTIVAMRGPTQVPAAVDNSAITAPSGVTTSVDTDTTSPTVTITVDTSVKNGGTVDIPVSLDNGNIVIHKQFTFGIAFTGATGAAGSSAQWYSGNKITGTSTITDNFTSDIGIGMYGIMGGYQISKNSPTGEVIKSEMLFSGSEYITVNEGEYLTIVNAIISKAN